MKKEKKRILYIHGYGGLGNSRTAQALKDYLPEYYDVFEPCFPLNPSEALKLASETVLKEAIDIIVASSLGAFTALQLHVYTPKIVINPCLFPSKELSKRTKISNDILQKFVELEEQRDTDDELWGLGLSESDITFGVFSTNDGLFSYKDQFLKHYSNVLMIEDTHRISVDNVKKVIVPIISTL